MQAGRSGPPEGRNAPFMRKHNGKASWRGWPALVFGGMLVAGLLAHEAAEVLLNATLLCLSCLGLGK